MSSSDVVKRKKKGKKEEHTHDLSSLPATEKYINKIIMANSPYLDKGVAITKKYLNPFYVDPHKSLMLPPLKSPYMQQRTQSSEPRDHYGKESKTPNMPSLVKKSTSPEPKFISVKSRYMSNSMGYPLFGNQSSNSRMTYYFYDIALGNNGELIRKLVSNRSWWKDRNAFKTLSPTTNFAWGLGIGKFNYDSLTIAEKTDPQQFTCFNRFQNGFEINDKDNLYRNIWHFYAGNYQKVTDIVPLTFSFRANELNFRRDLQQFCRFFLATKKGVPPEEIKPVSEEKDFEGNPYDVFYAFNNEFPSGSQTTKFLNYKPEEIVKEKCLFNKKNLWMLKPSGLNRGKGLELFTTLDELNEFLKMFAKGYDVTEFANMEYDDTDEVSPAIKAMQNKDKARTKPLVYKNSDYRVKIFNFVIQKYIEKPMLYMNHKFDMRIFAVMTHERELYVFGDCYVRLSSLPYDADKKNYLIHLTNNAVQVRSNSFGSVVKGNILSIREFEKSIIALFKETGDKKYDIQPGHFMRLIKEAVKVTFDSTEAILHKKIREYNFELFGYDFMIDENMKLWLIEVNSIPALGETNQYVSRFMHRALDDMLKLTIDKIFPPPSYASDFVNTHQDLYPLPSNKNLYEFVHKYPL